MAAPPADKDGVAGLPDHVCGVHLVGAEPQQGQGCAPRQQHTVRLGGAGLGMAGRTGFRGCQIAAWRRPVPGAGVPATLQPTAPRFRARLVGLGGSVDRWLHILLILG